MFSSVSSFGLPQLVSFNKNKKTRDLLRVFGNQCRPMHGTPHFTNSVTWPSDVQSDSRSQICRFGQQSPSSGVAGVAGGKPTKPLQPHTCTEKPWIRPARISRIRFLDEEQGPSQRIGTPAKTGFQDLQEDQGFHLTIHLQVLQVLIVFC